MGINNRTPTQALSVTGNISCTGSVSSSSDARLKSAVEPINPQEAQRIFDTVRAKRYKRVDIEQDAWRIGYIADEVKDAAGAYAPNLVGSEPAHGYLTMDYSRMTCLLWEVTRGLQARVTALEAKLEAKSRKKPAA